MAKFYRYDKVVDAVLSPSRLYAFNRIANSRSGNTLAVVAKQEDMCYTHNDYWDGLTISLGRDFYKVAWDQDNKISVMDIRDKYKHIGYTYIGVFYHELGHVMYTDMNFLYESFRYLNRSFRDFVKPLVNILEDVTVEGSIKRIFPYTSTYIDVLNSIHTRDKVYEVVSEQITTDPLNPGTLLSYLLLISRGIDTSKLPRYDLYEDNKEFIKWGAVKCINTINARLRHRRQIAYAQQLCKLLNMEAPDNSNVESGNYDNNYSGPINPVNDGGILGTYSKMASKGDDYVPSQNKQDSESDIVTEDLKEQKAVRHDPTEFTNEERDSVSNTDLTEAAITMIANNEPVTRYTHRAERLDNFCCTSKYLKEYEYYVNKHLKEIGAVVSQIRKMKAQNNSGWLKYKTSGKFDVSTTYKLGNYKFFKQRKAPSPESDLVVEILVDNSGSMGGKKSKLAGEALIIFCEALNRLHIPFAVDAFTEGRSCVTIKLKEFNDDYNRVKTNMTLFTEQFNCDKLCTFSGNIDEVNLRYVRDILNKQPHRDKMCIVISDGATCGDWETLRAVAKNMEASGTLVLGIGIFDNNVEKIYDNHIILKQTKDLEQLGSFLNRYLVHHVFK